MDVILRPYRSDDIDQLLAEASSEETVGSLQWFGYQHRARPQLRREFEETGFVTADSGRLVVGVDGDWAGEVGWWKNHWGPPAESWCWQLGILLRPDMRGQGVGTKAQTMLVDYLFAHTHGHRIEAITDVDNLAEQRSLEKAGFAREGVLRAAQWRGGRWHDQMIYSRVRDDPS